MKWFSRPILRPIQNRFSKLLKWSQNGLYIFLKKGIVYVLPLVSGLDCLELELAQAARALE